MRALYRSARRQGRGADDGLLASGLQAADEAAGVERALRVQVLLERSHHREAAPNLAPRIECRVALLGRRRACFDHQAAALAARECPQTGHQTSQPPERLVVPVFQLHLEVRYAAASV